MSVKRNRRTQKASLTTRKDALVVRALPSVSPKRSTVPSASATSISPCSMRDSSRHTARRDTLTTGAQVAEPAAARTTSASAATDDDTAAAIMAGGGRAAGGDARGRGACWGVGRAEATPARGDCGE